MEMRACDHQVTLPMFFGVTKKSAEFDFLVASDVVSVPGQEYMPSCAEIAKARAK
jgi:branched-chain amino acid transport system substrate-binding protein